MTFRHSSEELEVIGDPRRAMSYHRGGQAGAVAVSYSTSPMPPHSPSRRYSSGTSGGSTTTSGIGSSTSKFNTYRTTGTTSLLDRPISFYTPSSSSGLRSNYFISEYRRSYCTSGRLVSWFSAEQNQKPGSFYWPSECVLFQKIEILGEFFFCLINFDWNRSRISFPCSANRWLSILHFDAFF